MENNLSSRNVGSIAKVFIQKTAILKTDQDKNAEYDLNVCLFSFLIFDFSNYQLQLQCMASIQFIIFTKMRDKIFGRDIN